MLHDRRRFLQDFGRLGLAVSIAALLPSAPPMAGDQRKPIQKPIPSSGERLPVIGMGTSRTFDIGNDRDGLVNLEKVLQAFSDNGGRVIDSSPMYGSAEEVAGLLFSRAGHPRDLFVAAKVWIEGRQAGVDQMQQSMRRMKIKRFDLMQIHNLVDSQTHLETLNQWKAEGKIRYTGITTSHGRNHEELATILKKHRFDFVQLSYNLAERQAETSLLPIAMDRGIAVLANRPFQRGDLFGKTKNKPLPDWAREIGCRTFGQLFLKYIVSHPAVTCAIPATAKVDHMLDNMEANFGALPDPSLRSEMETWFQLL